MHFLFKKTELITAAQALPGREYPMPVTAPHYVTGHPIIPPFPANLQQIQFGMGCFWGAERKFWQQPGVFCTAVGYAGGFTPNPSYQEVCSGLTGHAEIVLVIFDPEIISLSDLLKIFWENHNPTQGLRQGNDIGSQYRSAIYAVDNDQRLIVEASKSAYHQTLKLAGYPDITTEIRTDQTFYYAEAEHQQYLAKNPTGYCGLGGIGIAYQQ